MPNMSTTTSNVIIPSTLHVDEKKQVPVVPPRLTFNEYDEIKYIRAQLAKGRLREMWCHCHVIVVDGRQWDPIVDVGAIKAYCYNTLAEILKIRSRARK